MAIPFQYRPLDSSCREIRLLELLPKSQWPKESKPAFRIFHSSLDQNPRFLALSYVWGSQINQKDIQLNGYTFSVTRNLFEALMDIGSSEAIIIWIDAICIDQKNNEEKGWQVAMMGDIYRKASEVIAWLGPSYNNSDRVIDHLNLIGSMAEACDLHCGPGVGPFVWRAMTENPPLIGDPNGFVLHGARLPISILALKILLYSIINFKSGSLRLAKDLACLYKREWWGRVWVLQEISLPKHVHFVCGKKQIPRQTFFAAHNAYHVVISTFSPTPRPNQLPSTRETTDLCLAAQKADIMLSISSQCQTRGLSLAGILQATSMPLAQNLIRTDGQGLQSTDPRDRVFGVLGLANDQKVLKNRGIVPNYTKSTEDIYTETMAALLSRGYISLLSLCRSSGDPSPLPSWVLDWSMPMSRSLQGFVSDRITLFPPFSACGSRSVQNIIVPDKELRPRTISMVAKIYDEILRPGCIWRRPGTNDCAEPDKWLCEILNLTYASKRRYSNFRERLQAVVRVSHANIGDGDDGIPQRVDRFLDALLLFQQGGIQPIGKCSVAELQDFMETYEVMKEIREGFGNPYRFQREIVKICSRRSPFITQKGHLGIGSMDIKQGDTVALIGGAQTPFILRKHGNGQYVIISEAYVDGIMDGEAAEDGNWEYIEIV